LPHLNRDFKVRHHVLYHSALLMLRSMVSTFDTSGHATAMPLSADMNGLLPMPIVM